MATLIRWVASGIGAVIILAVLIGLGALFTVVGGVLSIVIAVAGAAWLVFAVTCGIYSHLTERQDQSQAAGCRSGGCMIEQDVRTQLEQEKAVARDAELLLDQCLRSEFSRIRRPTQDSSSPGRSETDIDPISLQTRI